MNQLVSLKPSQEKTKVIVIRLHCLNYHNAWLKARSRATSALHLAQVRLGLSLLIIHTKIYGQMKGQANPRNVNAASIFIRENEHGIRLDQNKLEPAHGLSVPSFCSSSNLWSATRMIKSWSMFNFFGQAVRIIQDGKKSSPIRCVFSWVETGF